MPTALYTHPSSWDHLTPEGHPERVARMDAVMAALGDQEFEALYRREAPAASMEAVIRVHPGTYIEQIRLSAVAAQDGSIIRVDADTSCSAGSFDAALHAAGAVTAAVDAVMSGEVDNAFCAMRPPGHHAEAEKAMGFCLFNNVAIGTRHAQVVHGLEKVAIVDFDVHHGNGTEAIFLDDPSVFFASSHQMPLYPGTGDPSVTGVGNVVNVPLAAGAGGEELKVAWEGKIIPALEAFKPEILFISAGFDGHADDPLAGLNLVEADYRWITERLAGFAADFCDGRLVSTLEGGYDLDALGRSVAAHVSALLAA